MWSKIDSTLFFHLYNKEGLSYHNWSHITSCYDYLESDNQPYNAALDYAIAGHDLIVGVADEQFKSSVKTVEILDKNYVNVDVIKVGQLIMDTRDHLVPGNDSLASAIIRADLHQLQYTKFRDQIAINFDNLIEEQYQLDLVDSDQEAAMKIYKGAVKLIQSAKANEEMDLKQYQSFWKDVVTGLEFTLTL